MNAILDLHPLIAGECCAVLKPVVAFAGVLEAVANDGMLSFGAFGALFMDDPEWDIVSVHCEA